MPPHCDSLDGPVVQAARAALEHGDELIVLPYVHSDGETEVREAFVRVMAARALGGAAQEVADRWFFETVVRVHRAGEGEPYTGLKPAGLDVGPVIPIADRAGSELESAELIEVLSAELRAQITGRIEHLRSLSAARTGGLEDERRYVTARLALQVYSHRLYRQMHQFLTMLPQPAAGTESRRVEP